MSAYEWMQSGYYKLNKSIRLRLPRLPGSLAMTKYAASIQDAINRKGDIIRQIRSQGKDCLF